MSLSEVVIEIRSEKSRAEFAQELGLSEETIKSYELGRRRPGFDAMIALFKAALPEQQRALLVALGIEDIEQFAEALLVLDETEKTSAIPIGAS